MMQTRAEQIADTPFSLSLSSGFFGYFSHIGFMEAFEELGLKPSELSGSSAGALVAAGLASGRSAKELREIFLSIQKNDFWDPEFGFGYLKGEKIEKLLNRYCVKTFAETKTPLHISAFNIKRRKTEVLAEGLVAQAARASAAVPLLFHPVRVNDAYYWDGGIKDRAGHNGVKKSNHIPVFHYLSTNDYLSRLEDRLFYKDLHEKRFFFKIKNPFSIGPGSLENGPEIVEYFRRQTFDWLTQKIA